MKVIDALRRHPNGRPTAMIKQAFGMRQVSLCGLDKVRTEFGWAALAFNLQRTICLLRSRAGPTVKLTYQSSDDRRSKN